MARHGMARHFLGRDCALCCAILFGVSLSLCVCVCLRVYCVECVRRIGFVRMEKRRCRVCLLRRCVRCVVLFCVLYVIESRCVLCHTYSSKTHLCATFCHSCLSLFHSPSVTILSIPHYGFCVTERLPSILNYALYVIYPFLVDASIL